MELKFFFIFVVSISVHGGAIANKIPDANNVEQLLGQGKEDLLFKGTPREHPSVEVVNLISKPEENIKVDRISKENPEKISDKESDDSEVIIFIQMIAMDVR